MIKFYKHSHSREVSLASETSHETKDDLRNYVMNELVLTDDGLSIELEELDYPHPNYTHMVIAVSNGKSIGVAGFCFLLEV